MKQVRSDLNTLVSRSDHSYTSLVSEPVGLIQKSLLKYDAELN